MKNKFWPVAMAPEGGAGGGGDGGTGEPAPAPSPESLLFPNEGEGGDKKPANLPAGEGEGEGDKGAADWKEYEDDPAKSAEENARLKAEHDKAKPADDDNDDPANKVPADGKYALTMPEGFELDTELSDALSPEFHELGLTNAQAQKLADKYIDIQKGRVEAQNKTWTDTLAQWVSDAKADKDIGGDKWDSTVSAGRRAVEALGTPALKEYLNASGGGNHPELIRFMAKVGAMVKEDNPATGGAEGAGKPADPAHVLFPSDAPKGR